MTCIHGNDPQEYCRRCEREIKRAKAFEAMQEALIAISRGLTNGQKERGETFQTIARAALALADKVSR